MTSCSISKAEVLTLLHTSCFLWRGSFSVFNHQLDKVAYTGACRSFPDAETLSIRLMFSDLFLSDSCQLKPQNLKNKEKYILIQITEDKLCSLGVGKNLTQNHCSIMVCVPFQKHSVFYTKPQT